MSCRWEQPNLIDEWPKKKVNWKVDCCYNPGRMMCLLFLKLSGLESYGDKDPSGTGKTCVMCWVFHIEMSRTSLHLPECGIPVGQRNGEIEREKEFEFEFELIFIL